MEAATPNCNDEHRWLAFDHDSRWDFNRVWTRYCGAAGKPGGRQRKQTSSWSLEAPIYSTTTAAHTATRSSAAANSLTRASPESASQPVKNHSLTRGANRHELHFCICRIYIAHIAIMLPRCAVRTSAVQVCVRELWPGPLPQRATPDGKPGPQRPQAERRRIVPVSAGMPLCDRWGHGHRR